MAPQGAISLMPTMPNVVGQNFDEAVANLTAAGVYIDYPAYAFMSPSQITVQWTRSGSGTPGGIVQAQSPASGSDVSAGAALTLTVSEFPMAAVIG